MGSPRWERPRRSCWCAGPRRVVFFTILPCVAELGAIVFDMDGTLLDSLDIVPLAYIAAIREISGRICSPEEVIATFPVGPARAMLRVLLRRQCTAEDLAVCQRHLASLSTGLRCYPGVPEVVAAVSRIVPVGVCTDAGRAAAELMLGRAGLQGHLTALISGDDVARPKPAPDGVLAACRALGVSPGRAAYVGDAANDLRAARAAGVLAVAAGWGHRYEPGFPADAVLERPEALLALLPRLDPHGVTGAPLSERRR